MTAAIDENAAEDVTVQYGLRASIDVKEIEIGSVVLTTGRFYEGLWDTSTSTNTQKVGLSCLIESASTADGKWGGKGVNLRLSVEQQVGGNKAAFENSEFNAKVELSFPIGP